MQKFQVVVASLNKALSEIGSCGNYFLLHSFRKLRLVCASKFTHISPKERSRW